MPKQRAVKHAILSSATGKDAEKSSNGPIPQVVNIFQELAHAELRKAGWPEKRILKIETTGQLPMVRYAPSGIAKGDRLFIGQAIELLITVRACKEAWAHGDSGSLVSSCFAIGMLGDIILGKNAEGLLETIRASRTLGAKKTNASKTSRTDAFIAKAKEIESKMLHEGASPSGKEVWNATCDEIPAEKHIKHTAFYDHFKSSKSGIIPAR